MVHYCLLLGLGTSIIDISKKLLCLSSFSFLLTYHPGILVKIATVPLAVMPDESSDEV